MVRFFAETRSYVFKESTNRSRTRYFTMKLKELLLGINLNEEIRIPKKLKVSGLLTSIYPLIKRNGKATTKIKNNIVEMLNYKKRAIDSGGFQILTQNLEYPDIQDIVNIINQFNPRSEDIIMQLDIPTSPFDDPKKRIDKIERTSEYFKTQRELHDCWGICHGMTAKEIEYNAKISELDSEDQVAFGSFLVTTTRGIKVNGKVKRANEKSIYERIGYLLRRFKDKTKFVLGAGTLNACHIAWANGSSFVDGASYRTEAMNYRIFIPETQSSISVGAKPEKGRAFKKHDYQELSEFVKDPDYPFEGLNLNSLLSLFKMNNTLGFESRMLHNAYCMVVEEQIANSFTTDPDGYHKYLENRFSNYSNRRWLNRYNATRNVANSNYVETQLDLYFR